jgi:gas vesicle protein
MAEKREFLLGILMGSAIGAAVALLYAPQAGDGTRDLLRQKASEAKEKASELADGVKTTVVESAGAAKTRVVGAADTVKEKVVDVAGSVRGKVADVTGTVKSSTHDMLDRGRTVVETKKAQVVAAVEAGKHAFEQKKTELEADVQQDLADQGATSRTGADDASGNINS